MGDKQLKQQDAEYILGNETFGLIMERYLQKAEIEILSANTPDEAYRASIGMQKAHDFIREIKSIIDDGLVDTYNQQLKDKHKGKPKDI